MFLPENVDSTKQPSTNLTTTLSIIEGVKSLYTAIQVANHILTIAFFHFYSMFQCWFTAQREKIPQCNLSYAEPVRIAVVIIITKYIHKS